MRKLFNRHKIKKKWGRGVQNASKLVFSYNQVNKHKDFDWHTPKSNPFKQTKEINWKKRIEISILVTILLSILGIMIYSPFFNIKKIEVNGLKRINQSEIIDNVMIMTNYKNFLIIPKNNYFTVDLNEVNDILKQKYPIQKITTQKVFPNKLKIDIEEKISKVIYDNGKTYSYLDESGKVVEILRQVGDDEWIIKKENVTSTNELGEEILEEKEIDRSHQLPIDKIISEMGDYPIIYTKIAANDIKINDIVLDPEKISGIIQWFNLLEKITDVDFAYFLIEDGFGGGIIKTRNGWDIKVKTTDVNAQLTELEYILKNKVGKNNLFYIDLRYPGRVYWK